MSLWIDVNQVKRVLLPDGWHRVADNSFYLDSYEYMDGPGNSFSDASCLHGGGQSGVCAAGFSFLEDTEENEVLCRVRISGPLTAIQAVGEIHDDPPRP